MEAVARQSELGEEQARAPSLVTLKHLLDTDTHYVYGRILDPDGLCEGREVSVAACANGYGRPEVVDVMHRAGIGTHYGLNLPRKPDTTYRLLALSDQNGNGSLDVDEVFGELELPPESLADADVLGELDITLGPGSVASLPTAIRLPPAHPLQHSLFYPGGAIRELDDPLFDPDVATLGVYEPAAFTERAPTMFHALEEDVGYKIPVVFVHGLGGSAREFEPLVRRLDRARYKPWFFYYPSGAPLDQLARLFHDIYLSGEVAGRHPLTPMVILAHSMGGLVVREALNLLEPSPTPEAGIRFVSIASPLAGHPSAAAGERRGLIVVPSWRSLVPDGPFVRGLYRRPLPPAVEYLLIYAFRDDGLRFGRNSDGVVPLASQLRPEAQAEASLQRGFDATHTGILVDEEALAFLADRIHEVPSGFPSDHMAWLLKGGFVCPPESGFDPLARYAIETTGQYVRALVEGVLSPLDDEQRHFVDAVHGRVSPSNPLEEAWSAFIAGNPDLVPLPAGPGDDAASHLRE